jgi:hypothetical protein
MMAGQKKNAIMHRGTRNTYRTRRWQITDNNEATHMKWISSKTLFLKKIGPQTQQTTDRRLENKGLRANCRTYYVGQTWLRNVFDRSRITHPCNTEMYRLAAFFGGVRSGIGWSRHVLAFWAGYCGWRPFCVFFQIEHMLSSVAQ